ncbi:SOS response-associated peptidase [Homoserinimonas sp. A447]
MCGRFAMNKEVDDLIQEYVARGGDFRDWRPAWNIAPTDQVPVIRQRDGQREVAMVRWGIVSPSSPTFGGGKPIINARMETVATNGLFRDPFTSHRCIVPALGYYEWQLQNGGKQPYFIHEPGDDLAMAGIIRPWRDRSKAEDDPDRWRLSMAIITRDAHVAPGEVHDRMPACLTPDSFDDWLGDHLDNGDRLAMLDQASLEMAHRLAYYPVSKAVNGVKNDGPQLVEPIDLD